MPALDRNYYIHNERRPMPEPPRKGNAISAFLLTLPVATVLWLIVIAVGYQLATHAPEGWWIL